MTFSDFKAWDQEIRQVAQLIEKITGHDINVRWLPKSSKWALDGPKNFCYGAKRSRLNQVFWTTGEEWVKLEAGDMLPDYRREDGYRGRVSIGWHMERTSRARNNVAKVLARVCEVRDL